MGTRAEQQTEWARLVIDSFVHAGVRQAIISPGSRSTPFVIAALEHGSLECTSAFDERSAAHYALGMARSTLVPSLLICTSGSAPANYFPAIVEASEAGIPLLVLSADRPPELHHCGANQTTDQLGLYGSHVRFFANLGESSSEVLALRAARRLVARAFSEATGPKPGPVHLNAQARKPLESAPATGELRARFDAILDEPMTRLHRVRPLDPTLIELIPPLVVDEVAESLDKASRPVVLCGPSDVRSVMFVDVLDTLCERAGSAPFGRDLEPVSLLVADARARSLRHHLAHGRRARGGPAGFRLAARSVANIQGMGATLRGQCDPTRRRTPLGVGRPDIGRRGDRAGRHRVFRNRPQPSSLPPGAARSRLRELVSVGRGECLARR